jgi:hypothetical protein
LDNGEKSLSENTITECHGGRGRDLTGVAHHDSMIGGTAAAARHDLPELKVVVTLERISRPFAPSTAIVPKLVTITSAQTIKNASRVRSHTSDNVGKPTHSRVLKLG